VREKCFRNLRWGENVRCPFCGLQDTRVIDSRLAGDQYQVRRRRECADCGERFTTFESAELVMPRIRKNDGSREPYDEEKLRAGMMYSLYKRPVATEDVEAALNHVQYQLRSSGEQEVEAKRLGEWVMEELRELDHVAYVRFASVYRSFQDVNAFREEIDRLESQPSREAARNQLSLIDPDAENDSS